VQFQVADELIKMTPVSEAFNILDVGCGTGGYTALLRDKFADARIEAIDISREMIEIARHKYCDKRIQFVVADGERVDLRGKFDLVTSNAAFQWFSDLEGSLGRYKRALLNGGAMLFSTFGPLTFHELGRSLKEALNGEVRLSAEDFLSKKELTGIMSRHFGECFVEEKFIRREYRSLKDLLEHIKYTGTTGIGVNGLSRGRRDVFDMIEEAYRSVFGRIEATYQIFYCRGLR
jgi:malonyl-CoA O-methyltransferase